MDKEIKEMAEVAAVGCGECYTCEFRTIGNSQTPACVAYSIANEFYKAGYRKVPKDAIIISKEYYKRTVEIDVACEIAFRIVDIEQNARKEALEAFIEELKKQFDRTSAVFYPTDAIEKRIDKVAKDFGIKTTKRKNKKKHPNFKNHTSEPDWN